MFYNLLSIFIDTTPTKIIKDLLVLGHLLSLAVGLGTVLLTDLHLARHAFRRIQDEDVKLVGKAHHVITAALWGLWVTGLGLFYLKTNGDLAAASPKLWAKLATVMMLTATAVAIARIVVPQFRATLGNRLIDLGLGTKLMLGSLAGMSAAGWMTALLLGGAETTRTAAFNELGALLATTFGAAQLVIGGLILVTHFALPQNREEEVI